MENKFAPDVYPHDGEDRIDGVYLYLVALVAAVGGFLFGYDLSLISGAILFLKTEFSLTPFWFGFVAASAVLGCPFGPLAGGWMADTFGRRNSLVVASILFMVSALGSAAAPDMLQLSFWRFVGGLGVGLASTVSPMYIAEIAPAHLRGRLVVVNQLAIVIGLSLAVCATYFLSFGGHWRWMFASEAVPILFLMVGLAFVPRSPRWLAAKGLRDEALAVLSRINGPRRAEAELAEIEAELGVESGGMAELLRPGVRRALWIGLAVMVFSQVNGVNMLLIYAPTIFMEAGISQESSAILNTVYVNAWITICTVAAFRLTALCGRRPILIAGTTAMGVGHVLICCSFFLGWPTWVLRSAVFVSTGAFTLSLAPLSWVLLSEIFPNRVRAKAMSLCTCAMFLASYFTVNVFPVMLEWFKGRYGNPGMTFILFAGICFCCSLFVWRTVPETKDRTLEEIGEYWLRQAE